MRFCTWSNLLFSALPLPACTRGGEGQAVERYLLLCAGELRPYRGEEENASPRCGTRELHVRDVLRLS